MTKQGGDETTYAIPLQITTVGALRQARETIPSSVVLCAGKSQGIPSSPSKPKLKINRRNKPSEEKPSELPATPQPTNETLEGPTQPTDEVPPPKRRALAIRIKNLPMKASPVDPETQFSSLAPETANAIAAVDLKAEVEEPLLPHTDTKSASLKSDKDSNAKGNPLRKLKKKRRKEAEKLTELQNTSQVSGEQKLKLNDETLASENTQPGQVEPPKGGTKGLENGKKRKRRESEQGASTKAEAEFQKEKGITEDDAIEAAFTDSPVPALDKQ